MYTEDLPSFPREVYAAFVLTTVPTGRIDSIDASNALVSKTCHLQHNEVFLLLNKILFINLMIHFQKERGVLAFYSVKDIPGLNSFTPPESALFSNNEEMLCDGQVKYYNQPLGIVVAETRPIAERATKLVEVKYSNIKDPVIDIKEAKKDKNRLKSYASTPATDRGSDVKHIIKGSNYIYEQYHMCMETLACVTRPTEEGLEVHSTTQWLDGTQLMISRALNMDVNR